MVSMSVREMEPLPRRVGRTAVSGEQSTPEIPEDERMVLEAQDGDRASFGRLYERYARMVHGVLLAKVPVQDVDDLTHDVFLRALHRLSTLREIGKFGAWLAAIARNMANDYHRRAVPKEALTDEAPGNETNPPATAADENYAARVLEVIRSLPDAYRENVDPAAGRRHDRARNRRAYWTDGRFGTSQFASRHAAASSETEPADRPSAGTGGIVVTDPANKTEKGSHTERDDYLWDGAGELDPEVQRLEAVTRKYRSRPSVQYFLQSFRASDGYSVYGRGDCFQLWLQPPLCWPSQ